MLTIARRAAAAILVLSVLGMVSAAALELPAQFVSGTPADEVTSDAIWDGTALSAPLAPWLALALALWLTTRSGWPGTLGVVLFAVLGVLMTIGGFGEYAHGLPFEGVDTAVFLVFNVVGLALTMTLLLSSLGTLISRARRSSRGAQQPSPQ